MTERQSEMSVEEETKQVVLAINRRWPFCGMISHFRSHAAVQQAAAREDVESMLLPLIRRARDAERKAEGLDEALHSGCTLTEDHPVVRLVGELRAELEAKDKKLAELREALKSAGDAIHSEYCGERHHRQCIIVSAALLRDPQEKEPE